MQQFCKVYTFYAGILLAVLFCGCNHSGQTNVVLQKQTNSQYTLVATTGNYTNQWKLPYPVYRFITADINNDGNTDILVGLIKTTRFDTIPRKRLFIYKLVDGCIRPMWLGSRVGQPLIDFSVSQFNGYNVIRTAEYEHNGNCLVAEYKYQKFGIKFIRYIERNISPEKARLLLNNKP